MRSRLAGVFFLILLALAGIVCWFAWPSGPAAGLSLSRVAFPDLPGWDRSDAGAALAAFRRSCASMQSQPPDTVLGTYAGRIADWRNACTAAQSVRAKDARTFFEQHFVPFAVAGDGLCTGYYEILLRGSRSRHDVYQTPVYALPADLVSVDLGAFRPDMKGEHISGRLDGQHLVPYATRADIDAKPPGAVVLFYGDDAVAVFFLHI
jgi:membrane-bound lytic murein transglycosylase A